MKGNLSAGVLDRVKRQVAHVPIGSRSAAASRAFAECKDELPIRAAAYLSPRNGQFSSERSILLGTVKYLWYETSKTLSSANLERFGSRLRNLSHVSIAGPVTSQSAYITKNPNPLIGRLFKEIIQLGASALDGLPISDDLFNL